MKHFLMLILGLSTLTAVFGADIYMAGDSTMQTYRDRDYPQQGWGQRVQELTVDGVKVSNQSLGGRSTKSFKAENRWANIMKEVKKGDFVIIQFGHNDATKAKPERYAEVNTEYKANLEQFIDETREAGATPVLVTSIPQGNYLANGHFKNYGFLDPYVNMTKKVAADKKVDVVDLYQYACSEFDKVGEKTGLTLYNIYKPGDYPNQPEGKNDHTHITFRGAYFYAAGFVALAKQANLPIAKLFKDLPGEPMATALKMTDPKKSSPYAYLKTLSADEAAIAVLDEMAKEDAAPRQ